MRNMIIRQYKAYIYKKYFFLPIILHWIGFIFKSIKRISNYLISSWLLILFSRERTLRAKFSATISLPHKFLKKEWLSNKNAWNQNLIRNGMYQITVWICNLCKSMGFNGNHLHVLCALNRFSICLSTLCLLLNHRNS